MRCNLRCKFFLLFLLISAIALSASILIRNLIISDFRNYLDGDAQDRIQRYVAMMESGYERTGAWNRDSLAVDLAWALQMGLEIRLYDASGTLLMETSKALELLSPLSRKRLLETTVYEPDTINSDFTPYPLYVRGAEIGYLEARFLNQVKDDYFIRSSNRILLATVALLGFLSVIAGLLASRHLSTPIKEISEAATDIASGNAGRRVVVTGRDELGKLSESFNQMAESLEAQEKLRRGLLAGAAHELRTPLAIISGELEGMIDGVLPAGRENLQSMHDEASRLTSILNGLDELTRAESSSLSLQKEEVELLPFLSAIKGRFDRLFDERRAVLLLDCPAGLSLKADPDRLSQIIINLLTNALKAINTGGRTTIVSISRNDMICIEVSDNGCGIAAEDLPHVFERFYRKSGDGLGLGLAITRELVAAHGGSIEVRSTPQEGTLFRVSMPRGKTDA